MSRPVLAPTPVALRAPSVGAKPEVLILLETGSFYFALTCEMQGDHMTAGLRILRSRRYRRH